MNMNVQCPALPRPAIAPRLGVAGVLAALSLATGLAVPYPLSAQDLAAPMTVAGAVEKLKPGEYIWAPQVAPEGPIMIVVSLQRQRAFVYRNGMIIGVSTVSTGSEGRETPVGIFTVLQKHIDHKSNLYNDAPMPFMQRLTWDGIAMHAGKIPGFPASHGCIRLPIAFAKLLYGVTVKGMTVIITDDAPVPRLAPSPALFSGDGPQVSPDAKILWQPELASAGPISVIVSAADKRMIVLRNGKQIASAPIALTRPVVRPAAYMVKTVGATGPHWLAVALPWDKPDPAPDLEAAPGKSIVVDEPFRHTLVSLLTPGATVVITPDTLQAGSTGAPIVILSDDE
ncbi:MAG: L,D-transpeptidase [Sphingopyxis sp.]|nr:L,D-transpeptidase [Sphingopyxis sp.]